MAQKRRLSLVGILFAGLLICLNLVVWCSVAIVGILSFMPDPLSTEERFSEDAPHIGEQAPDFTLSTPDGREVHLGDFQGKVVLLNFWATWCPPCRAEIPLLETYHRRYTPDLVVLAVNDGEKPSDVRAFIEQQRITFQVLLDPAREVNATYGITALPTTFFIDRQGTIQAIQIGMLSQAELDANLLLVGVK
ncbi:MAG: hypothetical protein D6770_00780 [Anaerolineae bacterium]|nr:MAG: hypothetical protein D6770_00780 [Anaerolineae bacterium]